MTTEATKPAPASDAEKADTQPRIVLPGPLHVAAPAWGREIARLRGLHEVAGSVDNPWIIEALRRCGISALKLHDETFWCSAGLSRIFDDCGAGLRGTRSAAARSWLSYGLQLDAPVPWCIQVFERHDPANPSAAHVNLHLADLGDVLVGIGCNQSNAIGIDWRPKSTAIGYRWPSPGSLAGAQP